MVGLGGCAKSLTTPVIFEDDTMNAKRDIEEVLPVARKCGNNMLRNHWTYQTGLTLIT